MTKIKRRRALTVAQKLERYEAYLARMRKYYHRNKGKISARRKKYYQDNREHLLLYQNEYNRERKAENVKAKGSTARKNSSRNSRRVD